MYERTPRPKPGSRFQNTILRNLSAEAIARLDIRPVTLKVGDEIEFPGQPIRKIYFVEEGVISVTVTFGDGSQVEVGMFGYESVVGISALMGTRRSLNRAYAQIAGNGYCCTLENAQKEFLRHEEFEALSLRYVQAQLLQSMQSAACNVKHNMEQRLSRWLLICADRAHSNELRLAQEFVSQMLGSTRSTVTLVAGALRSAGYIDYTRGTIRILDFAGLERRACACYSTIKNYLDNYANFDTSHIA